MPANLLFALVLPPHLRDRPRHPRACQELNIHEEIDAGCFLTGHPDIKEPVGWAVLGFAEERVYLFGKQNAPLGSVTFESVRWLSVENHDDVVRRFSPERLMKLGHHLLGFRASDTADVAYVVVEWEGTDRHNHDGIFCFTGLACDARARMVRDAILHHASQYRRATNGRLQETFRPLLESFEARKCEHCERIHKAA